MSPKILEFDAQPAAVSIFRSVGSITYRLTLKTEGTGLGTGFIVKECFCYVLAVLV